jgi:hypothetical protein
MAASDGKIVMTSLADEYTAKAEEALVMEVEAQDPFIRRTYAKLARHWHELAERVRREEAAAAESSAAK